MADLELWREFSAAAWGKLEERRLRIEALERQITARDKRVRNEALREAAALIGVKIGHGGEIGNCQCGKCNARRDDHAEILALIDRTAEGEA